MSLTIIVDTREQQPYIFDNSIIKTLVAGDYSVEGYENLVTCERKTLQDAYGTIGKGRKRFERELEKLKEYEYAAIIVEASLKEFLQPPPFSKLNSKSAINSLISWSIKYGIHVYFASDRLHGAAITYRILEKFRKYYNINKNQK